MAAGAATRSSSRKRRPPGRSTPWPPAGGDCPWCAWATTTFDAPGGPTTLVDLFEGRRQLAVYQFMDVGPGQFCPGCTHFTDSVTALDVLAENGVSWATVSNMPLAQIEAYKAQRGWTMPFVSSHGTTFASDCGAREEGGFLLSMFLATATRSSGRTRPPPGASTGSCSPTTSSTSPPTAARRSGRTHPRAGHSTRPTASPGARSWQRARPARVAVADAPRLRPRSPDAGSLPDQVEALSRFGPAVAATTSRADARRARRCTRSGPWSTPPAPTRPIPSTARVPRAPPQLAGPQFGAGWAPRAPERADPLGEDVHILWVEEAVDVACRLGAERGWEHSPWPALLHELVAMEHAAG